MMVKNIKIKNKNKNKKIFLSLSLDQIRNVGEETF